MPSSKTLHVDVADDIADELRALIRAGMESGPGLDAGQVFAELRASPPAAPAE